jgi:hypothetical protein
MSDMSISELPKGACTERPEQVPVLFAYSRTELPASDIASNYDDSQVATSKKPAKSIHSQPSVNLKDQQLAVVSLHTNNSEPSQATAPFSNQPYNTRLQHLQTSLVNMPHPWHQTLIPCRNFLWHLWEYHTHQNLHLHLQKTAITAAAAAATTTAMATATTTATIVAAAIIIIVIVIPVGKILIEVNTNQEELGDKEHFPAWKAHLAQEAHQVLWVHKDHQDQ